LKTPKKDDIVFFCIKINALLLPLKEFNNFFSKFSLFLDYRNRYEMGAEMEGNDPKKDYIDCVQLGVCFHTPQSRDKNSLRKLVSGFLFLKS